MKTVSYFLYLLKNDKRRLYFCIFILILNVFYLYQNNDDYFIFGYGHGLEKMMDLHRESKFIINMNFFFLRIFSYLGNLIVFNFIILMLYNVVFKAFKSAKVEAHFVYLINVLLLLTILYFYVAMK